MTEIIDWTPDLDDEIRESYKEGRPDAAIAEHIGMMLGRSVSRASVYSRARTLGLVGKKNGNPSIDIPVSRFARLSIPVRQGDRLLVTGDTQVPFHDKDTLAVIDKFALDFEPTCWVDLGDFGDFYAWSDFDKDPQRITANNFQEELDVGSAILSGRARRHPKARKVLIQGNHEDRLRRFLWRHPHIAGLRDFDLAKLWRVEGEWEILPYKSMVEYASLLLEHGDVVRAKAGYTATAMLEKRGQSGICGHTHRMSAVTRRDATATHIYVENGCTCLLNPEYTPYPNWVQGFTYAIATSRNELHVIPVVVKRDGFRAEGRWYRR